METQALIYLSLLVCLAGFMDAIAGGGGIITLPAYLNYGLREELLLGTNKLSSTMGTFVAVIKFLKELRFEKKYLLFVFFFSALGSAAGAFFISGIPKEFIRYFLIAALPAVSIFLLLNRNFGLSDFSASLGGNEIRKRTFLISFFISFYDGILGPGTGTFLALSYTRFCGYDLLRATALSKFTNLVSNVSALATFLLLGKVDIKLGLMMGMLSMAGNYAGSHFALKRGVWVIRPLIFLVSNILLAKIIWDMLR